MSDRDAPRVFVSYAHDSPEHKEQVRRFATFLRSRIGLDVHLDRWYEDKRRDWSAWAIEHLTEAEFILVIASPEYKRRADGVAAPGEGRGSQFEAAVIRNNVTRNLRRETERVLPVVLPGQSREDVPTFLNAHSTSTYHVMEFTEAGVSELLAAITGHGQYPMPERGQWRAGAQTEPERSTMRSVSELPWLTHSPDVRRDNALIDGVRHEDSIVLRQMSKAQSRSFVEVDLSRRYRRMTSVVGMLDDATEQFQVGVFRVYLDGHLWREYEAALGKPRTVEVDVTGVLKLRLEMWRQGAGALATGGRSSRFAELAWGNPVVF
jgi:hypothetical protein